MKTVLFACVHNAGRSQMAAAFFNAIADPSLARALSAGTEPASRIHPEVVEVMREAGIELAGVPQRLSGDLARSADVLVTMGCGETCPALPGVKRIEWNLQDPQGRRMDDVRAIRDRIRALVTDLANEGLR
jgi:arsenate reductase